MSILDDLEASRVFSVEVTPDQRAVVFTELCDQYFEMVLTEQQLDELILELKYIRNNLRD